MANPQKGVVGLIVTITILKEDGVTVRDIATATTKEIIFEKPDNTTVTKTAAFTTNGSDGKIYYTTIANDIDIAGLWQLQGHAAGSGYDIRTARGNMIVEQNAGE